MNKNRKIKRGLTTSLAVGMSVMMGAVPVFAAGTSSDADAVYKEETVYVNADATGTIDHVVMYLGDGKILHAALSLGQVTISKYNYSTEPVRVVNIIGD